MKKKRILALFLAAVSCLSLAVSASAANTANRKATDFRDFDRKPHGMPKRSPQPWITVCFTANPAPLSTPTAI